MQAVAKKSKNAAIVSICCFFLIQVKLSVLLYKLYMEICNRHFGAALKLYQNLYDRL